MVHPGPAPWKASKCASTDQGGEQPTTNALSVTSKCIKICGSGTSSRSCSKISLVRVYTAGQKENAIKAFAVLDEQSNRSLAKTQLFDHFAIKGNGMPYTLKTCSGVMETVSRCASNFVESFDGKTQISLPTLIECDMLPDDRSEIPSPEIARLHPHLKAVADEIPIVDPCAAILLFLG